MTSSSNTFQWFSIVFLAVISVILGAGLGVASQALLPVKTYRGGLPSESALKKSPLPKVYWLKAYSTRVSGQPRQRVKEILEGQPTELTDREIGWWLGSTFVGEDVKEDVDAKLGTPFVRIGGQGLDDAKEPVLTVTMPFKLKVASLPVSEVPLQFVATPSSSVGETEWTISNVRLGHARVPGGMASRIVTESVLAVVESNAEAKKVWAQLAKYRRISIRDNKLVLAAPTK